MLSPILFCDSPFAHQAYIVVYMPAATTKSTVLCIFIFVYKSTEDSDCEESESESSYSSDDDVRYVEHYNTRKQQDPQNRKKRVSKSKSKSTSKGIFKFNKIDMWDEGDLDTEKNEMFKELAKLMVTTTASHVELTTEVSNFFFFNLSTIVFIFLKKKSVRNCKCEAEWEKKQS
ncbi:hypothetical protein RFI_38461 [Reticulomyxa filosa]|uniref:Uncharacterized protein n=1 Tax=Reticulomyxa filosa TaxID=46433 RepID=X6LD25_RETFI|nr:hypothetical protein RFI_38461 [Reticulomyxa filosa]|eukprot:ETN99026.1 hypothetical protein RFI_38461 [Reticulomyxa filosa]